MSTPVPSEPALSGARDHVRRRDLQGLRAVAVIAVVAEHATGRPVGGFLGVDVFFVLSGFLIIRSLLDEHARSGRISLLDFVRRRVKRLAPVAVLVLGTTLVVTRLAFNAVRADAVAHDAPWVLASAFNWVLAARGTDYFAGQAAVSPLQHFWSLAVEEQFYLVWPLVLLTTLGRAGHRGRPRGDVLAVALAVLVIVASATWGAFDTRTSPASAYFSTAARAWELGVGALVAFSGPWCARLRPGPATVVSWAGCAGILVATATTGPGSGVPVPASLLPVVATALVVGAGASVPSARLWPLTGTVAGWVGDRSYSLYLWHFPVVVVLGPLVGAPSTSGVVVVVLVSTVLAAFSYSLVERPLLLSPWLLPAPGVGAAGASWHRWRRAHAAHYRRGAGALLTCATVVVVALALRPVTPPPTAPLQANASDGTSAPTAHGAADEAEEAEEAEEPVDAGPASAALRTELQDALGATAWPSLDPSLDDVLAGRTTNGGTLRCGALDDEGPSQDACSWGRPDAPVRVLLLGDSTAVHYLPALIGLVEDHGRDWRLVNRARFACPFSDVPVRNDVAGIVEACREHNAQTLAELDELAPDVVVITNSYQELVDDDTGRPVTPDRWRQGTTWATQQAGAGGATVVLLTPPPPDVDIESCYRPGSRPQDCVSRTQATWAARAEVDGDVLEGEGQTFVDGRPLVCVHDLCPAFAGTTPVKQDAVHLLPAFARRVAEPLGEILSAAGVP